MKNQYKILGLALICLSLSGVYSYADSVYGTMWKQEDTIVYPADDVTKVDFNNISAVNMLGGGGGVTEGSDVGFGVITGTQMRAGAGVFDNITINSDLVLFDTSGTPGTNDAVLSYSSNRLTIMTDSGDISLEPQNGSTKLSGLNIGIPTGAVSLSLASNVIMNWSNSPSNYTAGKDIGLERYAVGLLKVNRGSTGTEGALISPGVFTAFRNLSSAEETLTSVDHTVFCLANDNEVVATMPPCSGQLYSQQLMIIYTDSGSTNKCKLDGSGAETVASFDVFSGLDTFEEGCHFVCDGSGNWWRAGCF